MNPIKKEILITKDSVLIEIQNTFTGFFPFLKIEFLLTNSSSKSPRSITVHPQTSIRHLQNINIPQKINIDSARTVLEVSEDFKNLLGFPVEFSRKSGNVWNVISVTDGWTLERQNSAGKYISSVMAVPQDKN